MRIGSDAHRDAFCRQFTESYTEFDPERFPWPELDEAALQRLRAVPFWQEVLHTERRAGAIVEAFARGIEDPVVRAAVALQGREEARHASLLRVMIRRYGIDAVEQPLEALNPDTETAFIDFGYGECVDSFLGFGVFKIARQAGFLPEEMFKIFDTLMFEETRHIVFFVNWMAWREVRRGRGAGWQRALTSLRFYIRAARRLMGTVKQGQQANEGRDFSATQASVFLDGFTFRRFLENCHSENTRRMGELDQALLQPRFLPALAGVALSALRVWSLGRRQAKPA
ncbi:MAG TPA: ferritin-like domain-containing protein [Stellaceae bacterium]|nr:ferritin-like domain-containing protein [Stellaceae bacterium]